MAGYKHSTLAAMVAAYVFLLGGCGDTQPPQKQQLISSPENAQHPTPQPRPPKSDWPLFPAQKDGKYGYINKHGEVVIPFKYSYAEDFSEDLAVFMVEDKYGYLNKDGSVAIQPQFSGATKFSEGLAVIRVGSSHENSYGYIDRSGTIIINPAYSDAKPFHDGYAFVSQFDQTNKYGRQHFWIDKHETRFSAAPLNIISKFRVEQLYIAKRVDQINGSISRYRLHNQQGKLISKEAFDNFDIVKSDELASVCKGAEIYSTGYFISSINSKCALLRVDGELLSDFVFQEIKGFNEGFAAFSMGGQVVRKERGLKDLQGENWGFIDESGKIIINPRFDEVRPFHEGLAAVKMGPKWGYIDPTGKYVIAPAYGSATDFRDGLALVDSTTWIDKNGVVIFRGSAEPKQAETPTSPNNPVEPKQPNSVAGEMVKAGTGTMFVVSRGGYAITNHHVIEGCKKLRSAELDIQLVTSDAVNDLALIKLQGSTSHEASIASDPSKTRQGGEVVVFGFPLNSILSSGGNLTPGVISAITGLGNNSSQIQITAPIQPGSSGSPVMNKKGEVVAVVSSKLSDSKMANATGQVGQNVNFAVSGQTLKAFLDANKVEYKTGGLLSFEKSTADIADEAKKWTTVVECWK